MQHNPIIRRELELDAKTPLAQHALRVRQIDARPMLGVLRVGHVGRWREEVVGLGIHLSHP